jgi:GT2 family glycosyltransferase
LPEDIAFKIYLVDDASFDSTKDSVKEEFPDVKIIQGVGNLFWNGDMRMNLEHALVDNHNFYL